MINLTDNVDCRLCIIVIQFYVMASKSIARQSYFLWGQIENLIHQEDKLGLSASHCYARSVFSMSSLRMLILTHVDLDDTFYETMEKEAHHSKVSRIYRTSDAETRFYDVFMRRGQASVFMYNNTFIKANVILFIFTRGKRDKRKKK